MSKPQDEDEVARKLRAARKSSSKALRRAAQATGRAPEELARRQVPDSNPDSSSVSTEAAEAGPGQDELTAFWSPKWEERRESLLSRAHELPTEPGVYTFLDARHRPVYIGKAANLRSRVSSYFRPGADDGRPLFPYIVTSTIEIQVLVTASEKDALLLENNLIKQQKPRFNVMLTDDKTYLSIKLTTNEPWPRLLLVRRAKKDGGAYFGPFASASEAREVARIVKRHFQLRTCTNAEFRQRTRPCLEYQMGRCGAPCVDKQSAAEYQAIVDDVTLFLKGRKDDLIPRIEARMKDFAAKLQFEQAARARDELKALKALAEQGAVARSGVFKDQDAFGIARLDDAVVVRVLQARHGSVRDSSIHRISSPLPESLLLNDLLRQYYAEGRPVPDEVLLPFDVEDAELLSQVLSERSHKRVEVLVPQRGAKASLVAMAMKNAQVVFESASARQEVFQKTLRSLQDGLQLPQVPKIIECYDISTIQGHHTVASMVRFEDGEEKRDKFRRYRINSIEGQDDFGAMREVLSRRFDPKKALRLGQLPDLVVIDGGKGQLGVAESVLSDLCSAYGEGALSLVGLAKARVTKGSQERVFFPMRETPVVLDQRSPELLLLTRIRDAAHDHALGYHRELRRKRFLRSGLEDIPGVGASRRKLLIKSFGSLRGLRMASREQIAAVPGIPESVASAIWDYLQDGPELRDNPLAEQAPGEDL